MTQSTPSEVDRALEQGSRTASVYASKFQQLIDHVRWGLSERYQESSHKLSSAHSVVSTNLTSNLM